MKSVSGAFTPEVPKFSHRTETARREVEESHHWHATINGYVVYADRRANESTHIGIYCDRPDSRGRLGIVSFTPRFLSDLEKFAGDAEPLLRAVVTGLREAIGTDDLRGESERQYDEFHEKMRADIAKAIARDGKKVRPRKKRGR